MLAHANACCCLGNLHETMRNKRKNRIEGGHAMRDMQSMNE